MWSALGISEHRVLWGAGGRRALLNAGWLNSSKWQNLHQMSYISVIGEECRIHGVFSHFRTCWRKGGGGGNRFAVPCVALNLTCTHDRSVRVLLLSGSPREEHSNDLVTAMRKSVSSAPFRGEGTLKRLQTRTESVRTFQVLHRVYMWTDRRSCAHIRLWQLLASCFLARFFWWDARAINKSWSTASYTDGLNLSAVVERLMSVMLGQSLAAVCEASHNTLPHHWC